MSSSSVSKRKHEVIDLSDDKDEEVYDFIETCNEESTLLQIIDKATNRLSLIGLGVVLDSHCKYFETVENEDEDESESSLRHVYTATFKVGPQQTHLFVDIHFMEKDGYCTSQYKCRVASNSENDEIEIIELFRYQYINTLYDGPPCFNSRIADPDLQDSIFIVDEDAIESFVNDLELADESMVPTRHEDQWETDGSEDVKAKCIFADILLNANRILNSKYDFSNSEYFNQESTKMTFDEDICWEYLFPALSDDNSDDAEEEEEVEVETSLLEDNDDEGDNDDDDDDDDGDNEDDEDNEDDDDDDDNDADSEDGEDDEGNDEGDNDDEED